ncbi:Ras-related protein Rab [Acrasis kona]|uniref:Ras-related protein Rab n=1 Tax=Acrasis kona TaxID=1008807 RepID=A0AAW2YRI0_9EUKA
MNTIYKLFSANASTPKEPVARSSAIDNIKIVILGGPSVGKTALAQKYCGKPLAKTYTPTVGINIINSDYSTKSRPNSKLTIWDVPHTEVKGKSIDKILDAHGFILVFDISNPKSVQAVDQWRALIGQKNSNVLLIANKADKNRHITRPLSLDRYVRDGGYIGWYMTNYKQPTTIKDAFHYLIGNILRHQGTRRTDSLTLIPTPKLEDRKTSQSDLESDINSLEDSYHNTKSIDDDIESNPFESRQLLRHTSSKLRQEEKQVDPLQPIAEFTLEVKAFYEKLRECLVLYKNNDPHLSDDAIQSLNAQINTEESNYTCQLVPIYSFFKNETKPEQLLVMHPDRFKRLYVELRRSFYIETFNKWTKLWQSLRMEKIISELYKVKIENQQLEKRRSLRSEVPFDFDAMDGLETEFNFPKLSDSFPVPSTDIFPALTRIQQGVHKLPSDKVYKLPNGQLFEDV